VPPLTMEAYLSDAYSGLYGWVNATLIRLAYPAAACALYMLPELVLPRSRNSVKSYARGAYFMAGGIAINTLVLSAIERLSGVKQVSAGTEGANVSSALLSFDLTPLTGSENLALKLAGYAIATVGVAMIANFFYYWLHRAQHAVPLLWRFHRVHHSITELSVTSSYHHVAEDFFQFVAVTLPMAWLLSAVPGPVPWIAIVGVSTYFQFIHSSTKLHIGPLRYIVCDNRYHRIHHSIEPQHINRNFGTVTPLWDVLFGTNHFPRADEWPDVGLTDVAEAQTLREYLLMPFVDPPSPRDVEARPRTKVA
jgi:sterol desaturase/sphingolipid hydroxylase (fatty acid hydroxylase superfamily)